MIFGREARVGRGAGLHGHVVPDMPLLAEGACPVPEYDAALAGSQRSAVYHADPDTLLSTIQSSVEAAAGAVPKFSVNPVVAFAL